MSIKNAKLIVSGLFLLLMFLFAVEVPAQVDTTEQDTTSYPDTTDYEESDTTSASPDSLNGQEESSSILQQNYYQGETSYYAAGKLFIQPKENRFIRNDYNYQTC